MIKANVDLVEIFKLGTRRPVDLALSKVLTQNHQHVGVDGLIEELDNRLDSTLRREGCDTIKTLEELEAEDAYFAGTRDCPWGVI
jgi:hypothetical protein